MLIEFRVQNHRSLRDEQVLTLESGRIGDERDSRPRQVDGHSDPLLPVAVLYGANASGKSNVLAALAFMRHAVRDSHRAWSPDEGVPRDQFAWGPHRLEPSLFEVTVIIDGVRFQYGFVATDERFLEEWLHAWPHGKKQVWFERDDDKFRFGDNLKGENKLIEQVTRPNALFLSAAVQHRHPQLEPLYAWFRRIQSVNIHLRRFRSAFVQPPTEYLLARMLDEEASDSQQPTLFPIDTPTEQLVDRFRSLLKSADIGIVDFKVIRTDPEGDRVRGRPRFLMQHQSDSGDAWLPLEEESQGTRTLFRIGLPVLQVIEHGGILLVDELESSLHPALAQQIVRQFNDPKTNPKNAQVVFTTHDTNLLGTTLGEPAVRRDQVWLTEKDQFGATVLYPLTDYKPRKAENIERGYLQGRYGAIPFLGDFSFANE